MRFVRSAVVLAGTVVACSSAATSCSPASAPAPAQEAQPGGPHPRLLYTADQKDAIVARLTREPFATLWQRVRDRAAEPFQAPEPGTWVTGVWSANAQIAQANAVLAWALGDAAAGVKAKELLLALGSNYEDAREVDVDIKIARILVPYTNAWDLLSATPFLTAAESRDAQARITAITRGFVSAYLDSGVQRVASFIVTQNNHPLRAVGAVGYVALAFPDDPDAGRWSDWAKDTLDYLLGPKGHYVQADGAVSEGPFYYAFGFSSFLPYLIALDHAPPSAGDGSASHRVCITRNTADPWTDNGCVEGEAFTFVNPLRGPALASTVDWSIALRRPSGVRAELDDASIPVLNGGALMTSFGNAGYATWDWQTNETQALETTRFDDLTPWYLAYVTDAAPAPPPWKNRFFPAGGQAIFRSGWGTKDLWLTLVADSGPARKSLHNHADGTSFALAAYGDDLLIDTGYYKPDASQNPLTTDAPSHNVVLVDGGGAPKRGLLNDWGDTDAFLENVVDDAHGEHVAWAEARTAYRDVTVRRGVAFARNRYFVVADRIASARPEARTFQWRAHLWAGHDAGGTYALHGDRLTIDRAQGGLLVAASTTDGQPTFVEPPFAPLTPPSVHSVDGTPGDHAVADATISAVSPSFLVVLAPYAEGASGADGPLTVTAVDAGASASAWTVAGSGFRDVAWLRANGASARLELDGHVLETDAEVVLASVDGEYALVAGGSTLTLDGRALVSGNAAPVVVVGK